MNTARNQDATALVLRVAIGGTMLFHGVHKALHGISGIEAAAASHGLPRAVGYGVYFGEIVAPLCVLLGIGTRPAAAIMAFNMVVAIVLAHAASVASLDAHTGAPVIELPLLYLLGAVAIALTGAGRYSVSRGKGRWD